MPPLVDILIVAAIVLTAWALWAFIIRTAAGAEADLDEHVPESKNFLTRL